MTVAELIDLLVDVPSHYRVKVWVSGSPWGEQDLTNATISADHQTVLLED